MALSLGFTKGQVVQEFYADIDSDEALQAIVEAETRDTSLTLIMGTLLTVR